MIIMKAFRRSWPGLNLLDTVPLLSPGFGLAAVGAGNLVGRASTPPYMAPEVHALEPYGPAADLWSCGVVACEVPFKTSPTNAMQHTTFATSPHLVHQLSTQARQARHFLQLPKSLRAFLSQFFVPQRQRPTAEQMLSRRGLNHPVLNHVKWDADAMLNPNGTHRSQRLRPSWLNGSVKNGTLLRFLLHSVQNLLSVCLLWNWTCILLDYIHVRLRLRLKVFLQMEHREAPRGLAFTLLCPTEPPPHCGTNVIKVRPQPSIPWSTLIIHLTGGQVPW